MRQSSYRLAAGVALLLLAPLFQSTQTLAQNTPTRARPGGVYIDRDGKSHTWSINDAHTLIWDSKAFIPVGGMFCSKYLTDGQTDENWNADAAALEAIKAHGVRDVYINPVKGATLVPPEAWQRLVDHLDAEGFTYGVELTDGPEKWLTGWIVRPSLYRLPDIGEDRTVTLNLPSALGGIWVLADARTGDVVETGSLKPADGKVTIAVQGKPDARRVLLVYPVKKIDSGKDGLQNLWEGFGSYRDRLISVMGAVRFGKGLRFWVDPFINEMGLRGETPHLIPDSGMYQIELESWLRKRYPDIAALAREWRLSGEIKTYDQAARLIPLWHEVKGLTYTYDSSTGKLSRLSGPDSGMWKDLAQFRNESIRRYLNTAAMVLKKHIADVPVVVKWTASEEFLINDDPHGYDGLGVEAYGSPATVGPFAGAQCLALVEQWSRPGWLLTTETQTTASAAKPTPGYQSKQEMMASLGALQDAGSKGFYVFGLQLLPDPVWRNFELARLPEQMDWLREFREGLEAQPLLADWKPRSVWFSASKPSGADIRRLEQDLWWLPRKVDAEAVEVEPGVNAYTLQGAAGGSVYVWTTGAPRDLEVAVPPGVKPIVHFTGAEARQAKTAKKTITIPLTRDPAIVTGLPPSAFVTVKALGREVGYLEVLLARAEGMRILVGEQKIALENAKAMINADRFTMASTTLRRAISDLEPLVAPFFWVEGEDASESSFGATGYHPGASQNRYLKLSEAQDPPMSAYSASFPVFASTEAEYEVWMAGTPPGQTWTSPASWSVDGSSWNPIRGAEPRGQAYAPDLFWTRIATVHLSPGRHVFRLRADGRRSEPDNNYVMYIDALVVTREPFVPDGARRPEIK